jgi:hypothetical protein
MLDKQIEHWSSPDTEPFASAPGALSEIKYIQIYVK